MLAHLTYKASVFGPNAVQNLKVGTNPHPNIASHFSDKIIGKQ